MMGDIDIESLSDELQEQDNENLNEIIKELIKDVDPSDVIVDVDPAGRVRVSICGTPIGTIHRFAFTIEGVMTMKATFQPESVS